MSDVHWLESCLRDRLEQEYGWVIFDIEIEVDSQKKKFVIRKLLGRRHVGYAWSPVIDVPYSDFYGVLLRMLDTGEWPMNLRVDYPDPTNYHSAMSTEDKQAKGATIQPSEVATVRRALYDAKFAFESGIDDKEKEELLARIIYALDVTAKWDV